MRRFTRVNDHQSASSSITASARRRLLCRPFCFQLFIRFHKKAAHKESVCVTAAALFQALFAPIHTALLKGASSFEIPLVYFVFDTYRFVIRF